MYGMPWYAGVRSILGNRDMLEEAGVNSQPQNWDELRTVVTNHGPMSQARLEFRRLAREETRWVRESILGVPRAA